MCFDYGITIGDALKKYLEQFREAPNKIDEYKWKQLLERHEETGENILDLARKNCIKSIVKYIIKPGPNINIGGNLHQIPLLHKAE